MGEEREGVMGKTFDLKRNPTDEELLEDLREIFENPYVEVFGVIFRRAKTIGIYLCPKCGRRSLWPSCVDEKCIGCDFLLDAPAAAVSSVDEAKAYFERARSTAAAARP
jgi:hypothetical protein